MNKSLIVYNNPRIFAQSLSVLDENNIDSYDILINEIYHNTAEQVQRSREWIKEHVWVSPLSLDELDKNYDYVIRPTPVENDWLPYLYDLFPDAKYIYIEEWMWFYTSESYKKDVTLWDSHFMNWKVYLTYFDKVKWALKYDNSKVFSIAKQWYKTEIEELPEGIKTILFTEPYIQDEHDMTYKDKVEKAIENSQKPLLLKRHFRDDTAYEYWEWVFEFSNKIPGQLFFWIYPDAKIILTWKTTLELYIPDKSKIIKI